MTAMNALKGGKDRNMTFYLANRMEIRNSQTSYICVVTTPRNNLRGKQDELKERGQYTIGYDARRN